MRRLYESGTRSRGWKVGALVVLVLLAFLVPVVSPVVSIVTGQPVPGVTLELSFAYLVLAPICGIYDALTALSVSQHIAVLSVLLSLFVLWRLFRLRKPARRRGVILTVVREVGALAVFLVALVGFYAAGVLVPRPMARLHVDDPDVVVVDFHSHTLSSHDGRKGFTAERNRAWHRGSGFDVSYITDHDSTRAALAAERLNPRRAGDGTVVLTGREVVYRGMHVTVIGTFDPRTRTSTADPCGPWPVVIGTIPANLSRVPVAECPGHVGGLAAIELLDAAPRGFQQGDRDRERILALADSLDLAVVAASDNHGWGMTAAGWSLLKIPGWRDMTPVRLDSAIVETIRTEGRRAVQVVGLRRPRPERAGVWSAVIPVLFPQAFVSQLTRGERLVWILWIAAALWIAGWTSRRQRTDSG